MFYMGSLQQWHGGECSEHGPSGVPFKHLETEHMGWLLITNSLSIVLDFIC